MTAGASRSSHHLPAEPRRAEPERLYYEAPSYYERQPSDPPAVFLAGGITGCPRWHDRAIELLRAAPAPVVILNPNRKAFPISNPAAGWEQVSWEQHHLHGPHVITLMWFPACDPAVTTQPIAQFELGQALGEGRRLVVGAADGYPRKADVRMLSQLARPGMVVHSHLEDLVHAALELVAEVRTLSRPHGRGSAGRPWSSG